MADVAAGPLSGQRIIDFTWAWAGPYGGMLLALLGADVIKIESRTRMDHSRLRSLALGTFTGGINQAPMFNELNLNKRSLTLNLKQPAAKEVIRDLAAVSDGAIDNFRPGTLDRLELGYDELSKRRTDFVMVSASAVGATGPERNYAGYAPSFAALAGLAYLTGEPDLPPPVMGGAIDLRAGASAAFSMLLALYHRDRTGQGQFVDASAREAVAMHMGEAYLEAAMVNGEQGPTGNEHAFYAPHDVYACGPGDTPEWVAIACRDDAEWEALCEVSGLTGLPSDERFRTGLRRWKHRAELNRAIESWTRERSARDAAETLTAAGVPASPSLDGEALYRDAHFQARQNAVTIDPPELERRNVIAPPWRLSRTPAEIRGAAPTLGHDTHDVLHNVLGYDTERIEALEEAGALE